VTRVDTVLTEGTQTSFDNHFERFEKN
jgi:hypothetical protein